MTDVGKPPSMTPDDEVIERMILVRSRSGSDSWAEWDTTLDEAISAVGERVKDQKAGHPGFDVVEVLINRHSVVRAGITVDEGSQVGWHDAPAGAGKSSS